MIVLDSSALVAPMYNEPGKDRVDQVYDQAVMSTVNLAEVLERPSRDGTDPEGILISLRRSPIRWFEFDADQALLVTRLRSSTRRRGLSLGDRACLALATLLVLPVLTADRVWAGLDLGVEIELIR